MLSVQCSCCERRADVAWKRVPLCGDHGLEVARRLAPRPLREVSAEEILQLSRDLCRGDGSREADSR